MDALQIFEFLKENETIDLENRDGDLLEIRFGRFFTAEKKLLFILNGVGIADRKTKRAGLKKIKEFLDKGFEVELNLRLF